MRAKDETRELLTESKVNDLLNNDASGRRTRRSVKTPCSKGPRPFRLLLGLSAAGSCGVHCR
jgi:hypothetical protein